MDKEERSLQLTIRHPFKFKVQQTFEKKIKLQGNNYGTLPEHI